MCCFDGRKIGNQQIIDWYRKLSKAISINLLQAGRTRIETLKFMAHLPQLTAEQIQFFNDQGYLILRGAASEERVAHLRAVTEAHLAANTLPVEYEADVHYPGSPASLDAPGGRTVRRLLQAWDRDSCYQAWGAHPDLVNILASLLDSSALRLVRNHHNCIMTKQPGYSSSTLWHQDIRYWSFQSPLLVNVWLALGEETARNGCMRVIPGSHRVKWDSNRFDAMKFFRPDREDNKALMHQALRAELNPGDILIFHACLLHAAGRNHTDERKMALVYSYRREDNRPLPGTRSTQMEDIMLQASGNPLSTTATESKANQMLTH